MTDNLIDYIFHDVNILLLTALIAIFVGAVILQWILSKAKNKWLGFILPLITLLISFSLASEYMRASGYMVEPGYVSSWGSDSGVQYKNYYRAFGNEDEPYIISHMERYPLRDKDFYEVFSFDPNIHDVLMAGREGYGTYEDENGKVTFDDGYDVIAHAEITYDENAEICKAIIYDTNGEIIAQSEQRVVVETIKTSEIVFAWGSVILLYNIPTAILLVIYVICRKRLKKKRDLKKMSVQDLE